MYYHATSMKYIKYGKIVGNPNPDHEFGYTYRWLSNYCGYFPQLWLSRSKSVITGYKNEKDSVLFCFDVIKGFPVEYDLWCQLLGLLWKCQLKEYDPVKDVKKVNVLLNFALHPSGLSIEFEDWLKDNLFVKKDQVVVPSLNLKAAKEICCRNEKQKKKLRKMGFIEDRIKIKNIPSGNRW